MRLLGQTVEGLRSLRFIQLDEDVPSLILGINKVVNTTIDHGLSCRK